jgi:hypothetical protein
MSNLYYKRNYVDALKIIVPDQYIIKDEGDNLETIDIVTASLFSEIEIIQGFTNIFPLQANTIVSGSLGFSGTYFTELPAYFVKTNELNEITPSEFQVEVLEGLNYNIRDYKSEEEFKTFLSGTLLPKLRVGTSTTLSPLANNTGDAFGTTDSATFDYLKNSLGLFFLLNYDLGDATYNTALYEHLTTPMSKLWKGEPLSTEDAIKALKEYLFINQSKINGFFPSFLMDLYASGTGPSVSGTQQLENIKTITSIIHSDGQAQKDDTYVRDIFFDYFDPSTIGNTKTDFTVNYSSALGGIRLLGILPNSLVDHLGFTKEGNFGKLLRAVSLFMSDINDQVVTLETIKSIEECPEDFLPYLADLIGWNLYTSNSISWRRQLRNAVSLIRKKGTKEGLKQLLSVVLPSIDLDFENNYSEYYESYVPNLIYYLLKTDSTLLKDTSSWTQTDAVLQAGGEYTSDNQDLNIRYIIDHIILDSIKDFPSLFSVRGRPFDISDPEFVFNYRGRDFKAPPWEYEKFYVDCDITEEYVEYLKNKLVCLGVTQEGAESFETFVLENTVSGVQSPELYNNGFMFLTKKYEFPFNYRTIIDSFEKRKLELTTYWSAKSSRFNLTLQEGTTDDSFFKVSAYSQEDFFEALKATKDFIPATAISRLHADVSQAEGLISDVKVFPRVTTQLDSQYWDGGIASYVVSGLDMRQSVELSTLVGSAVDSSYVHDSRFQNDHSALPVFRRENTELGRFGGMYSDSSGLGQIFNVSGAPVTTDPGRISKRKRDYSYGLNNCNIYDRDGFNSPSFRNKGVSGDGLECIPLGMELSTYTFVDVSSHTKLPEVYKACETTQSSSLINGVPTSATFPMRGLDDYKHSYHNYVYRDELDECYRLFYNILYGIESFKVDETIKLNDHLIPDISVKLRESLINEAWQSLTLDRDSFFTAGFGRGVAELYGKYLRKFGYEISQKTIEELDVGGSSILSQIYGPIVYNANMSVDGSAISKVLDISGNAYNKKTESVYDFYPIETLSSSDAFNDVDDVAMGFNEKGTKTFISGIEIVDEESANPKNRVIYVDLSSDEGVIPEGGLLLSDQVLMMQNRSQFPRLRFSTAEQNNKLLPECEYTLDISSIFVRKNNNITGGSQFGVVVRTQVETDINGKRCFWVWTPNYKWTLYYPDDYIYYDMGQLYKLTFPHRFIHDQRPINNLICATKELEYQSLLSITRDDLVKDSLRFATYNTEVKPNSDYQRQNGNVHREDQVYFIEILPWKSLEPNTWWTLNSINLVNDTLALKARYSTSGVIEDFSYTKKKDPEKRTVFLYPNNEEVPLGTELSIDASGNVTTREDEQKVTAVLSYDNKKTLLANKIQFSQVSGFIGQYNTLYGTGLPFNGVFEQTGYDYNEFNVSGLFIVGTTKGTNVEKQIDINFQVDPRDLLTAFRFFKDQSDTIQGRNPVNTSGTYGESGGNRQSYREWIFTLGSDASKAFGSVENLIIEN